MANVENMTLKDLKEFFASNEAKPSGDMKIVVLDRGFVYVGKVTVDAEWVHIVSAKNIRIWGTTKGLGELALKGPTSKTTLDDVGIVKAPLRALISLIDTDAKLWK